MFNETTIGVFGLALCAIMCGIGSALGLKMTGSTATGILEEDPSKFSKVLVLVLLPATQGLYGLLIAFMGMAKVATGWNVFFAVLPMTVVGFVSALLQAKTSCVAIKAVGKKAELSGKLMMFPAMVETYALLSLVVSILLINKL